jgi:hypothetical protein
MAGVFSGPRRPSRREAGLPGLTPKTGEQGNVIIELALLLPVLLLLVGGIVDLAMLFWEKQILTNATREGARAAARADNNGVGELGDTEVMAIVQNYLTKFNLKNDQGTPLTLVLNTNFFITRDLTVTPKRLWVELKNIPAKMLLLASWIGGASTINLSAKTTIAAEWTTPHP